MKVIVIDDEPLACEDLIYFLNEYDDVEVVSECGDLFSALVAIRSHKPDVMFLDITFPGIDENGFTLLDYIGSDEHKPHVVIVSGTTTGYAVQNCGKTILGYLEKPVEEDLLKQTIEQIRQQLDKKVLPYPDRSLDIIPCIFNRRYKFIKIEDVEFVSSGISGVNVICEDINYSTELTLTTLLQKTTLLRCHKQHLIALNAVNEFEKLDNGLAQIHTHSKNIVPVSRHYRKTIEEALGI